MDNRRHPRTQCFQVSHHHDLTPVWVFRRATAEGILGLVVDFSESGFQALVEKDQPLDAEFYTLFVDGVQDPSAPPPRFQVARRWAGPHQDLYCRCGFEFSDPVTARACCQYLESEARGHGAWIRCELEPL